MLQKSFIYFNSLSWLKYTSMKSFWFFGLLDNIWTFCVISMQETSKFQLFWGKFSVDQSNFNDFRQLGVEIEITHFLEVWIWLFNLKVWVKITTMSNTKPQRIIFEVKVQVGSGFQINN